MLVRKSKYAEGDIITYKVVNGDECVAKFVKETDHGFTINKPYVVIPSQGGLALMPALFTVSGNQDINVDFQHIMIHGETMPEMVSAYTERTTGIKQVPKSSIII